MYFLSLYFWHLWPLLRLQRCKIQVSFCFLLNKPEKVLNCCSAKKQMWNIEYIQFVANGVQKCPRFIIRIPSMVSVLLFYFQFLVLPPSCPCSGWMMGYMLLECSWTSSLSFCRCLSSNAEGHGPPSLTTLVKQESPVTHSKVAAKIKQFPNLIYERARLIQCRRFNCIINTHYIFRLMWPLSASPWKSRLLTVVGQTAN